MNRHTKLGIAFSLVVGLVDGLTANEASASVGEKTSHKDRHIVGEPPCPTGGGGMLPGPAYYFGVTPTTVRAGGTITIWREGGVCRFSYDIRLAPGGTKLVTLTADYYGKIPKTSVKLPNNLPPGEYWLTVAGSEQSQRFTVVGADGSKGGSFQQAKRYATQVILSPGLSGLSQGDVLTVDLYGGLWRYQGSKTGLLTEGVFMGSGWQGLTLYGPGDWNGDGTNDLVGVNRSGLMFLWPGDGHGKLGKAVQIGQGWQGYRV
ncbi:MAG: VCBS repeat-containing protein, partial [Micrococcales bacterium]|nr:VCBS repeat-containing protein [Micrococcales bacterium]